MRLRRFDAANGTYHALRCLLSAVALVLLASCAGELETPGEALRIFGDSLPRAYAGEPYEAQIRAVGGLRPFTYLLQEGELPPGLDLEAGVLSGVPTETGTFAFTITVTDANLSRTFQDYSLEVVERPPPTLGVIAPQTEIRTPVTVRLQVENASGLRAFTTVVNWDEASFELLEGSVESVAGGAALVSRQAPGRLHLEMAALGEPWNGELMVAQFTLVPNGTAVLQPELQALFFDDSGGTHFQGAPGADAEQSEAEELPEDGPADEPPEEVPGETEDGAANGQADAESADDPTEDESAGDGPEGEPADDGTAGDVSDEPLGDGDATDGEPSGEESP